MSEQKGKMRGLIVPLIFGLGGFAILAALGIWQLQRLAWKESVLSEMEALLNGAPMALEDVIDPYRRFAPVQMTGTTTGQEVHALKSTGQGAGYRLVSRFAVDDGPVIMLDEGFIRASMKDADRGQRVLTVEGNLHVPDDVSSATPAPDLDRNIWYGRDMHQIAEALETEPIFVVARQVIEGEAVAAPLPLSTAGVPNSHLGYAVQWFGLAAVWLGMTLFLLWRIRQRTV